MDRLEAEARAVCAAVDLGPGPHYHCHGAHNSLHRSWHITIVTARRLTRPASYALGSLRTWPVPVKKHTEIAEIKRAREKE